MKIKVGDKVAYSVQWLKSTGLEHTIVASLRGTVLDIESHSAPGYLFEVAQVKWDGDEIMYINVENLAIVGPNTKFCSC